MRLIRMEVEVIRQRRLLWELVKRDLRSRYVGSVMGLFWSVINPLVMLIIYIFVFSLIFQMGGHPSRDVSAAGPAVAAKTGIPNFPVYLCCGLLPWNAILESLLASSTIIVGSGGLIKRAVFPMFILPMQAIVTAFVNLTITLLLFGVFLLVTGDFPGAGFLMIFPLMALQFFLVVGACYFFATITVFFRDMAPLLSAMMNFLFWASPIVYTSRLATDRFAPLKYFYLANPISHLARLYREFLYVDRIPETAEVTCSITMSVLYLLAVGAVMYVIGKYVFTRSQPHFVDEV